MVRETGQLYPPLERWTSNVKREAVVGSAEPCVVAAAFGVVRDLRSARGAPGGHPMADLAISPRGLRRAYCIEMTCIEMTRFMLK